REAPAMKRSLLLAVLATGVLAAPAHAQTAVERSQALVAAQAPFASVAPVPAATARVVADDVARSVPLPAGGTFPGIRCAESGGRGGALAEAEMAWVPQYNAACQWLRAWRDGRDKATSLQVLGETPAWPAWRLEETAGVLGEVVSELRAGGGELASGVLADC